MTQTQWKLPVVDRVTVHVEQMSGRNSGWKHFQVELGPCCSRVTCPLLTAITKACRC